MQIVIVVMSALFLSTLSLRRATIHREQHAEFYAHFYPRSPCGERRGSGVGNWPRVIFLSTLSLRRATAVIRRAVWAYYISIHALLAESDALGLLGWLRVLISIHALLAESDVAPVLAIGRA